MFKYFQGTKGATKAEAELRQLSVRLPEIDSDIAGMSWAQLHEVRSAIRGAARKLLEELGKAGENEERAAALGAAHDTTMGVWDAIGDEFDKRSAHGTRDSLRPLGEDTASLGAPGESEDFDAFEVRNRDFAAAAGGQGVRSQRSGWVDGDGREVRIFKPSEQLSETRSASGMQVGDVVRAMVYGARNEQEKRALSEGTNSAGGYTVPAPLATYFIDRLRSHSVCIKAGAQTVELTSNTLAIARLESDPAAAWTLENAPVPTSDATFGRLQFTARKLAVLVKLSRELLEDSVNVGEMVTNAFAQSMSLELDRVCLFGSGVDPELRGVANTPGINTTTMAANGAAPTNGDPLIDAVYEITVDNAGEPTAAIFHPRTWKTMAKLKDTQGQPLRQPDEVAKLPKLVTTAMPITETQGTSSDASSIITGNFAHMMIGVRKQLEIIRADNVFVGNDQIAFLARLRADVQLAHPEAFNRTAGVRG